MDPYIIPIRENFFPKEGKRSIQCTVDLSSQSAVLDLVNIAMRGQVSQLPSVFFDNADNDFTVTMVMEGTLQRLVCPPNSQGYFRLLLPQKPRLGFVSEMPLAAFKVNLLNWVVEQESIWRATSVSGGTVTSVGLSAPGEFVVTGSPVTTAGTLALSWAQESANRVLAGPISGAPATPGFRPLVAGDIPALNYVTSVGLALPAEFNVTGSPVTTAGTLTGAWANQNANKVFAGPASGAAATPAFRSLVVADLPITNVEIKSVLPFSSGVALTTAVAKNVTSINLPVGTFEVSAAVAAFPNSTANMVSLTAAISQVSNTLPSVTTDASGTVELSVSFTNNAATVDSISPTRITNAGPGNLTVFLVIQATFGAGAVTAWGTLRAVQQII